MKKVYDDDDGHTIADMSGVKRDNILIPRLSERKEYLLKKDAEELRGRYDCDVPEADKTYNTYSNHGSELSKGERRFAILGAMSAGLVIALVFIVVIAIVIIFMLLAWRH